MNARTPVLVLTIFHIFSLRIRLRSLAAKSSPLSLKACAWSFAWVGGCVRVCARVCVCSVHACAAS